ncbi:MAG: hypothetical protein J7M08_06140 [Planctomycetes bacterium]|nr:hypothetical protein [Planctomycetota bacterium]
MKEKSKVTPAGHFDWVTELPLIILLTFALAMFVRTSFPALTVAWLTLLCTSQVLLAFWVVLWLRADNRKKISNSCLVLIWSVWFVVGYPVAQALGLPNLVRLGNFLVMPVFLISLGLAVFLALIKVHLTRKWKTDDRHSNAVGS